MADRQPGSAPEESSSLDEPGRRKLLRAVAYLVVPVIFVGFLAYGLLTTTGPRAKLGTPAPDFELPLLGGGAISGGDLEGSPVVINFWASWCIPCRQEARDLEEAWQRYRDRGVKFLGINIQDTQEDAAAFVSEFGITYPVARDVNERVARRFGVRGIPETFFIDHRYRFFGFGETDQIGVRGGTVVYGPISPGLLRTQVDRLLAGMEEPPGRTQ